MVFAVWACPEPLADGLAELEDALVASVRQARAEPEQLALRGGGALRLSGRLPRALLREAALPLRPARARRPLHVPRALPRRRSCSRRCPSCASCRRPGRPSHERHGEQPQVAEILEKALDGERIDDADAVALLRSRDLVAVGRAANAIRNRLHDPDRVTFIIDRNLNYTNICVTDCDFCAFYRSPGRRARGLPAAEAGDLQEDRGDARDRRHGAADAGRPPSRPRDRLLRGSLPVDQGEVPDPSARAVAAGDPAHLAPLEADDPGDADAAARRRARLDPRRRRRGPRRPRARHHRAEEDEVAPSG